MEQQINEAIRSHFLRIEAEVARGGMKEADPMDTNDDHDQTNDKNKNSNEGDEPKPSSMAESHLYNVETAFLSEDRYWMKSLRKARFSDTMETGILYRPQIVDGLTDLVRTVLRDPLATGIMLKGPQGVGKSHSLVSLVRKLVYGSGNRYLVTFIPDCEKWTSAKHFLLAVSGSFGLPSAALNLPIEGNLAKAGCLPMAGNDATDSFLEDFVSYIDGILESMGKQWVFVFDQINRIFTKPECKTSDDLGVLPFPFNWIKRVMNGGRITSIISASADNQVAYKDKHEGFVEFVHTTQMTEEEIIALYRLQTSQVRVIDELTGRVPLYIREYLRSNGDIAKFEQEVEEAVKSSLRCLKKGSQVDWEDIEDATIASLLAVSTTSNLYDRKFFTRVRVGGGYIYEPLVPQVRTAARQYLWDKLMQRISQEEANLLAVCADPSTRNSARGHHFQHMAIQRCLQHGVVATIDDVSMNLGCETAHGFAGRELPRMNADGIYFPYNPQFPAVDLVLKKANSVFGVQIHVNPHEDVITRFAGMCRRAGWFEVFENVYLVYLSPEEEVKELVGNLVNPAIHNVMAIRKRKNFRSPSIHRVALSKEALDCLANLQWPARCSINSQ